MQRKEQILKTAVSLFNDRGYANVSLREIAKEAGTTIGNLTYHFPKKEDLVFSLLDTLQTRFILDVPENKHRAELLSHLLNSFLTAEQNEKDHPFYYKNIYDLTMCSETLAKRNKIFQKDLYDYYIHILTTLKEDGVLKESVRDSDISAMSYMIVLSTAAWMQINAPYCNDLLPNFRISVVLLQMVQANISEEYEAEFRKLAEEKGMLP